ncbi:hypothetical protein NA78x_004135 [Anatilimnocola sp. NA78]|uniref:hypothetical protein n=1 Tax=Anatilimnocola sp. NA78 TaxID=3415683 RepID=UPI003CE4598D
MTDDADPLIYVFDESERKSSGAYFWDSLREELPAWRDLEYEWIASSTFGDQVIRTQNSPIHDGPAIYMHGPDVAGPRSPDTNWIENILFLGNSESEWLERVRRFGDEYAVAPASIDDCIDNGDEYRAIYRLLNPGLKW